MDLENTKGEEIIIQFADLMHATYKLAPDLVSILRTSIHMGMFIGLNHSEYSQAVIGDLPGSTFKEKMPEMVAMLIELFPISKELSQE